MSMSLEFQVIYVIRALSLSFLLLTKRKGDLRDCCEKCLSGAHELGLKAPTQSSTRNPISGCVHTITDSFSC